MAAKLSQTQRLVINIGISFLFLADPAFQSDFTHSLTLIADAFHMYIHVYKIYFSYPNS
jgi:Co/Zn/Cd efflux system component